MLRYIYASDLHNFSDLAHSMFTDRADQFQNRLGWAVDVDENGEEKDQYDDLNPLYVIWEEPDGSHGGSMRFLPTTGPVMVNDVFSELNGGLMICSPLIWECTRFCLSRKADTRVAGALTLGGTEIMRNFYIDHFTGVFDHRMIRIYRSLGFCPEVIGSTGEGRNRISLGLWDYSSEIHQNVARLAGISPETSQMWFDRSFGATAQQPMAMSA